MKTVGPQNPYEVYCYQCHVTAPVGSRICVHCGGRFSNKRMLRQPTKPALPFEPVFEEDDHEEEELSNFPQQKGGGWPMSAVWILLLVGGSLMRMCE